MINKYMDPMDVLKHPVSYETLLRSARAHFERLKQKSPSEILADRIRLRNALKKLHGKF